MGWGGGDEEKWDQVLESSFLIVALILLDVYRTGMHIRKLIQFVYDKLIILCPKLVGILGPVDCSTVTKHLICSTHTRTRNKSQRRHADSLKEETDK